MSLVTLATNPANPAKTKLFNVLITQLSWVIWALEHSSLGLDGLWNPANLGYLLAGFIQISWILEPS